MPVLCTEIVVVVLALVDWERFMWMDGWKIDTVFELYAHRKKNSMFGKYIYFSVKGTKKIREQYSMIGSVIPLARNYGWEKKGQLRLIQMIDSKWICQMKWQSHHECSKKTITGKYVKRLSNWPHVFFFILSLSLARFEFVKTQANIIRVKSCACVRMLFSLPVY